MDITKYTDLAVMYVSEYGIKIIVSIAIFIIGKIIVKRTTTLLIKIMDKAHVDNTLVEFLSNLFYFVLIIVVVLASLNTLGINTTSFLAVFGAASLAIGLALKDSLSNIGAAVLIIIFRPFEIGDFIEAADASGTVEEINLFSTVMVMPDNKIITIPNSKIIASNITNFSSKPTRRVNHTFSIDYGDDLKLAKETMMRVIHEDSRVLEDPAPFVAVSELGDNSVNFVFRVWVKTEDYWNVHFDMLEKVKLAFDEQGISIPFPQMALHLNTSDSAMLLKSSPKI